MSDWQSKVGGVLNTIGAALKPPDAATQFDPASLPTTRQPGYEKAAELAQIKAHQTVEEGHEQQRIDIDRQKTQAMVNFYKVRDQEALAKMGSKRDPNTNEIIPDPTSLAYQKQQTVQQHYQDQQEHYKDQYNLGLLKDELGRETNEIKKADIRARIAVTQQRVNQRDAANIRAWAAQEYTQTGIINPQADQIFKQGGFVPGGQAQPGQAAQNIPMPQGRSQADAMAGITGKGTPAASPTAPQVAPSAAPPRPKKVAPNAAAPAAPGATPTNSAVNLYPGQKAPIPPAGERGQERLAKPMVEKALQGETAWTLMGDSWARIQKTGVITGPDSMNMLAGHLAMTIGAVPGAKTGRDVLLHHLQARSLDQSMEALTRSVLQGGVISRQQADEWGGLAIDARSARWATAAKTAKLYGTLDQVAGNIPSTVNLMFRDPKSGKTAPVRGDNAREAFRRGLEIQ